jgi:hypothetical protein
MVMVASERTTAGSHLDLGYGEPKLQAFPGASQQGTSDGIGHLSLVILGQNTTFSSHKMMPFLPPGARPQWRIFFLSI